MARLQGPQLHFAVSFGEQLRTADLWAQKAARLLAAASLLRPQLEADWSELLESAGQVPGAPGMGDLQAMYFMLVAFAIENQCKGQLVHLIKRTCRICSLRSSPSI